MGGRLGSRPAVGHRRCRPARRNPGEAAVPAALTSCCFGWPMRGLACQFRQVPPPVHANGLLCWFAGGARLPADDVQRGLCSPNRETEPDLHAVTLIDRRPGGCVAEAAQPLRAPTPKRLGMAAAIWGWSS